MNEINDYAKYLGALMKNARRHHHIPLDAMAGILRISSDKLKHYENGVEHVPLPILERVFVVGYGFMSLQYANRHYQYMTRVFIKRGLYKYMHVKTQHDADNAD